MNLLKPTSLTVGYATQRGPTTEWGPLNLLISHDHNIFLVYTEVLLASLCHVALCDFAAASFMNMESVLCTVCGIMTGYVIHVSILQPWLSETTWLSFETTVQCGMQYFYCTYVFCLLTLNALIKDSIYFKCFVLLSFLSM